VNPTIFFPRTASDIHAFQKPTLLHLYFCATKAFDTHQLSQTKAQVGKKDVKLKKPTNNKQECNQNTCSVKCFTFEHILGSNLSCGHPNKKNTPCGN